MHIWTAAAANELNTQPKAAGVLAMMPHDTGQHATKKGIVGDCHRGAYRDENINQNPYTSEGYILDIASLREIYRVLLRGNGDEFTIE